MKPAMNKIRAVCVLFLFLFLNKTGSAQNNPVNGKISLRQSIETALTNNLDVQQRGIDAQRSKIDWNQARLNLLPSLNANTGTTWAKGRTIDQSTNSYVNSNQNYANYNLGTDVILFRGLYLQNTIKQNALAYEAAQMDWQQQKDNVTISVILAYLQVLNNEDVLELSRQQLTLSKSQVDRLETLNREGAILPSDLSDLKGEYANNQLSIITAQNAIETSKINLCQLMNIPYDKNMQLERIDAAAYATRYEQTPDSIYQVALQEFAMVKAADFRTESSARAVKAARGQLYPTFRANGGVGTTYTSLNTIDSYKSQLNHNRGSFFGIGLDIPIFNSFFARNRVKLAKLTLKNNELQAQTTKTQLQQNIEQAYANMTAAADRYKVLLDQVNAYTESFRAAEIRFNAGVGTSIDYLLKKNALDRSNINVITAKYDYVLRTKILDYYQGKQLW